MRPLAFLFLLCFFASEATAQNLYFPPNNSETWETTTPEEHGWCNEELDTLTAFLDEKNTKGFLILKDGKIAYEQYFGTFTADSAWYWASAGKTVTAFLVGMAQEAGDLDIRTPTSEYLGEGWTSLPPEKEREITPWHQLTMTSGLDDGIGGTGCLEPRCLVYKADAGTRWAYHNPPYRLLLDVLTTATGSQSIQRYTRTTLLDKVGMEGLWFNYVFYSRLRDMARFGLLMQAGGKWDGETLLADTAYLNALTRPSQNLNPSYGYLWWLNGQEKHMLPQAQFVFDGPLIPSAPAEVVGALGKNDQKIYLYPSENIVVVRMGESAGQTSLASSSFDTELWAQLMEVFAACEDEGNEEPEDPTGLEANTRSEFRLFPNPCTDYLSLPTLSYPTVLLIRDAQGRLIKRMPWPENNRVSVRNLRPGMYLLQWITPNGLVNERFIKK